MKKANMMAILAAASVFFTTAELRADDAKHASEGKGFGTGAVVGVLVGGPVGAAIGAGVGAWLGNRIAVAKRVDPLEQELEIANSAANGLKQELTIIRDELRQQESLSAELQHRQSRLAGLSLQVLFKTGNADIDAATGERMAELAEIMTTQPGFTLEIDGYADERGDESFNLELSRKRADTIVAALIAYGVPAERLQVHAHGEVTGSTEGDLDAYALERRVTMRLVESKAGRVASN
ncbi:MAG: OmpA family protein [Proteobacteria bacterium]|nr:OmpA family protein [Pseudomonadota bacterium]